MSTATKFATEYRSNCD